LTAWEVAYTDWYRWPNQVANLAGDSHCWASQQWHPAEQTPWISARLRRFTHSNPRFATGVFVRTRRKKVYGTYYAEQFETITLAARRKRVGTIHAKRNADKSATQQSVSLRKSKSLLQNNLRETKAIFG